MLKRLSLALAGLLFAMSLASAQMTGTDSVMQKQQAAIGQLQLGMGTATGNTPTINNGAGLITTAALSTAAGATQTITLTNSRIAAGDLVFAIVDPNGTAGTPVVTSVAVSANTAAILIQNIHASAALNSAIKIMFFINKAGNAN